MTAFVAVSEITLWQRVRLAHRLGESVLHDMRVELMGALLRRPMKFYHATRHGSLISRMISDIEAVRNGVQNNLPVSFVSFGQMIAAGLIMLAISWKLFLILLVLAPGMHAINVFFKERIAEAAKVQIESFSRVTAALAETVQGIRVTQGFNRETVNAGIFGRLVGTLADNVVRTTRLSALYAPLLEFNASLFLALLVGVGGLFAMDAASGVTVGDLVAFFFLANLFFGPITLIGNMFAEIGAAMAGADRLFRLLDTPPEHADAPGAQDPGELSGRVELRDVNFSYLADKPVLHGVSFVAEPGMTVAFVGHTGSGKSSIINLLAKYYPADSGEVLFDGKDISTLRGDALRRRMGFVLQSNFLFRSTVADNIRVAKPDATDAELTRVLRDLDCLDLVANLPDGLATEISEKGRGLSPGPAADRVLRARHARQPAHPNARRGDEQRRHPHRGQVAARPRHAAAGTHRVHRRAPAVHHPQRRPRARARPRQDHRTRRPRLAPREKRRLRRPSPPLCRGDRRGPERVKSWRGPPACC